MRMIVTEFARRSILRGYAISVYAMVQTDDRSELVVNTEIFSSD
jgi:hypothetical protein